jgi:SnoaL-like polyketide cyclase
MRPGTRVTGIRSTRTTTRAASSSTGRPRTHPTRGGPDHRAESERFCAAFPDNKVKHPNDILFGDGEYTAFLGPFTGTFTGPLELPDGTVIEPTGKSFEVVFSTIARWRDGKIVEEYLKYDNGSFCSRSASPRDLRDAPHGG